MFEEGFPVPVVISAVLGIMFIEYSYFTSAEEVRLLYVLLLIPVGGILGAIVMFLVLAIIGFSLGVAGVALVIALIGGVIYGVWYVLYHTVIWTNSP